MADENDNARSYPATPRRLEQARERGQVARSRELTTAAVVLTAALTLWQLGPNLLQRCLHLLRNGLSLDREAAFDTERMGAVLHASASSALLDFLPLLALLVVAMLGSPL